jgi:hypothetical protein
MRALLTRPQALDTAPVLDRPVVRVLRPIGRFVAHLVEMCMVMCVGAIALSVLVFGVAAGLGFSDMPERQPELTVLLIAINLSLPMAAWMRYRAMGWRPTLEMSGATMVVGLLLIAAYWLGIVDKSNLVDVQTSLACPSMLPPMLFRYRLYSGGHAGHAVQRSGPHR